MCCRAAMPDVGDVSGGRLHRTLAARRRVSQHARMLEQFDDRLVAAVAVGGIVVEVAGDHEARVGIESATAAGVVAQPRLRSEEHTSELQSLMRISYAVFCLKKKKTHLQHTNINTT